MNQSHLRKPLFRVCVSTLALIFLSTSWIGCGRQSNQVQGERTNFPSELQRIAATYKDLRLMTPEPVLVNPELAMLCSGASLGMVEEASVDDGPHANCAIKIFMNDAAATAFASKETYPAGSVIIKEKHRLGYRSDDGTDWQGGGNGVGGMIKRGAGYDEENGDWEYFYWEDPDVIEHGKIESCVQCHEKARASDFVFGSWADAPRDESLEY